LVDIIQFLIDYVKKRSDFPETQCTVKALYKSHTYTFTLPTKFCVSIGCNAIVLTRFCWLSGTNTQTDRHVKSNTSFHC